MSVYDLPPQYKWLADEGAPKMIVEFLKIYGTKEALGSADNPAILSWAKECGIQNYVHDSIAWCGLTMAVVAKRAGKVFPKEPLWALNWKFFGVQIATPMLGDVLVFSRVVHNATTGKDEMHGHVGLYIGEDDEAYHVGGGNQGDDTKIVRVLKTRLVAARRPIYKTGQPANVRKIVLSKTGELSSNES